MNDNTELQRLMRIRRLGRQIADDLNREKAFQTHGYALPAGYMSEPTSGKAMPRAQLEAALANYHGPVTLCRPAPAPEPDRGDGFIDGDEDEVDEDVVTGR